MRRRALCAASGGGGFYAEFFFDYCEPVWGGKYCYRAPSQLGVAFYENAMPLLEEYGVTATNGILLENLIDYGFEVYIEGELCDMLFKEEGGIFLITHGEYDYSSVLEDGSMCYNS